MIKTYAKGRVWEYKVRDFFEKKGCLVQRSAKSSFPDLWVLYPSKAEARIALVECKVRGKLNNGEVKQLNTLKLIYDVEAYVAKPKFGVHSKKNGNVLLEEVL